MTNCSDMAGKCLKGYNCPQFEEKSDGKESKGKNWLKPLAIGGTVIAPIAVPSALGVLGFSSCGVVGSSTAAAMMSSVGNVAAGTAGLGGAGTAAEAEVAGATGFSASAAAGAGKDEDKGETTCDCKRICKCNMR